MLRIIFHTTEFKNIPSVVYGMIGTKSLAMTVRLWPSIENFCTPSAPALIRRSLCTNPGVNLVVARGAPLWHVVLSPAATVEQLKLFFPLIKLLSENGGG